MKNIIYYLFLTFLISVLSAPKAISQKHEIGIRAGIMNYRGDMTPLLNYKSPGIGAGVFYRFNFNKFLSAKANVFYGQITDKDSNYNTPISQVRGHSFKTIIIEMSAQLEYNFFDIGLTRRDRYSWTPYLFLGFGGFRMSPVENIQPTYGRTQICIPFGVGAKFLLRNNLALGIEMGARKTFTNYIDDIGVNINSAATRNPQYYTENPNERDMYFFTAISLSYIFPISQVDCPVKIPR